MPYTDENSGIHYKLQHFHAPEEIVTKQMLKNGSNEDEKSSPSVEK